ncbi:MAG TPA: LptE family protein [Candidatus Hydrogenedentes bacterium]|nr:LptE family protein [Candidatus Hydrogenedentota bacterium]HQE81353.1 LptE family protein [Candidatus Hydrogenedentota bacterium]HQH50950.1 LptE family protein [Candidatus Hydrogenedentota bacterium]HQM47038.1 LptE family protein [Candidatus Hydrogenedentota bacterium]
MSAKTGVLACIIVAGCAAGCGYSTRSTLDERYQTIAVPAFKNLSKEYDLQAPLTNAVIRKFMADSRLEVTSLDRADLILEGVILDYSRKGLTYDRDDEVTQFLCFVTAGARLTDSKTGEVLWEDGQLVGETTFYTRAAGQSSDRLRGNAEFFLPTVRSFPSEEENRGVAEALEQLASDIFLRTIEPW